MKNGWHLFILTTSIISFLLIAGCAQPNPAPTVIQSVSATVTRTQTLVSTESSNPLDYFPMDTGDEWIYYIRTGSINPVIYENVYIVMDQGTPSFPMTGPIISQQGQVYVLKMKVKGPFRGGQRLNSVDLEILQDDLGLFRYTTDVYWGIMDNPTGQGVQAMEQAASYSSQELATIYPYPELHTGGLIHSFRMIFIWNGYALQRGDDETITYLGMDNTVPGYEGSPCYHFIRKVTLTDLPGFKPFTEDTWYAKGKGLVRLEQKIGGQTSMVWELEKFTPGSK